MKRRVIMKNVNRFITPMIKDMPQTQSFSTDIRDGDGLIVLRRQHIIVNGRAKKEGERGRHCDDILLSIRRTADSIKQIRNEYKHILLRMGPVATGNRVYVRLITE